MVLIISRSSVGRSGGIPAAFDLELPLKKITVVFLIPLLALALPACKDSKDPSAPTTVPVQGKILDKKGNPYKAALVEFSSPSLKDLTVKGSVKEDGSYSLFSTTSSSRVDGAPEGEYSVNVHPRIDSGGPLEPIPLKKKYTIKAGGDTNLVIQLE